MARRFVDISMHLENDVVSDPPGFGPEIEYFTHKDTAADVVGYFPGLEVDDLPEGEGWAIEKINLVRETRMFKYHLPRCLSGNSQKSTFIWLNDTDFINPKPNS